MGGRERDVEHARRAGRRELQAQHQQLARAADDLDLPRQIGPAGGRRSARFTGPPGGDNQLGSHEKDKALGPEPPPDDAGAAPLFPGGPGATPWPQRRPPRGAPRPVAQRRVRLNIERKGKSLTRRARRMARAGRRSAARWASPRLPFAPETPSATPSARRGGRTWTPETLTTTVAAEVIVGAGRATDTDTAHSCRGASLSVQQTAPATAPAPPVPPTTPAARKGHGRRPAARRRHRTPEAGPTCPSAHSRGSQASARGTVKYPR
jgi:hypothetical protein